MKQKVLVYAGANTGGPLIRLSKNFDVCYAFEAHPRIFQNLEARTKNYSNIQIFNVALTTRKGPVLFYEYIGMPYSSSLGAEMCDKHSPNVRSIKKYTVKGINLMDFLRQKGVEHISLYLSDLQGVDFDVLQTLKPLIDKQNIDKIICEVEKDDMEQHYKDLSSNRRSNFDKLLEHKYQLAGNATCAGWICSDITWIPKI